MTEINDMAITLGLSKDAARRGNNYMYTDTL
jgi:hypothetical protein